MPKMTAKWAAACRLCGSLGIEPGDDQPQTYQILQEAGYQWNSKASGWELLASQPANDPSPFIRFRIWADAEIVPDLADDMIRLAAGLGLVLVEKSQPYPCRPPQQLEARVYLTFVSAKKIKTEDTTWPAASVKLVLNQ